MKNQAGFFLCDKSTPAFDVHGRMKTTIGKAIRKRSWQLKQEIKFRETFERTTIFILEHVC